MIARRLAGLQEGVLDNIKAAHPGTRDNELAAVAGVDRTQVSHWRVGNREMRISELVGLQGQFGAVAVFGPLVALDAAYIRERSPSPSTDIQGAALAVASAGTTLATSVHVAMKDGLDDAERRTILDSIRSTIAQLEQLAAAVSGPS